jgi:hypothetical protein
MPSNKQGDVDLQALINVEATNRARFNDVDKASCPQANSRSRSRQCKENILHRIGIADRRIIYEQRTGAIGNPADAGMAEALISYRERNPVVAKTVASPQSLHPSDRGIALTFRS